MNIKYSNIAKLPTKHGDFLIQSFQEGIKEHLVIFTKEFKKIPNIRIHSECLTGDAIGSIKCDCQPQLNHSLDYISKYSGMIIYLRQEGRNIGLFNKVNAYSLQDEGYDTIQANHQLGFKTDQREYKVVEYILNHFKIDTINLITNNPAKIDALKNIKIAKRIPVIIQSNKKNENYLKTKKEQMGHLL
jgi:GTP cyclohydrolase II